MAGDFNSVDINRSIEKKRKNSFLATYKTFMKEKIQPSSLNGRSQFIDTPLKLPTPPAIAMKILDTLLKTNFSSEDLAHLIEIDPALTIRILGYANSPFYLAANRNAGSVRRAIDVLGINAVRNIALSFSIVDALWDRGTGGFDYDSFWKESVIRASAASIFAAFTPCVPEDAFIVALLADVGKVLMFMARPDDYLTVQREVRGTGARDCDVERRMFTYDHQDIGSETLRSWGMPESIYQPVACHHSGSCKKENYADLRDVIQLADLTSKIYVSQASAQYMQRLCGLIKDKYSVNADDAYRIVDEVAPHAANILNSLDMPASQVRPYSALLQRANERLSDLHLEYDHLLRKFEEEKARAEMLERELREANERLIELVATDNLTGLRNSRYFHAQIQSEMLRAQRYAHKMALVMIDIDDFKRVNDTHGHLVGDMVLKSVAGLILGESRSGDTVARYGGEEFAVVLPETDLQHAAAFAERVRKTIEMVTVSIDKLKISVTVSLGVCVFDPAAHRLGKDDFIKAADKALYSSKKTGKNRLSIASY